MSSHLNLNRFIEYFDAHPEVLPLMDFEARGVIADAQPKWNHDIPQGQVILYPAFVVFLTEDTGASSTSPRLQDWLQNARHDADLFISQHVSQNDASKLLADLASIVVGPFQDVKILEKSLLSPHSVFIPAVDIKGVKSGKTMMTHSYITIETAIQTLQLGEVASHLELFGNWQQPFITRLQEIIQGSQWRSTKRNGFNQGSRGTVTEQYGDAIHGDSQSYKKDMYYGRVSQGAELLLMDDKIEKDQFDLEIVKVKVLTNEWESERGKIGWVGLDVTSFKGSDD